jgi:hypothetical protein
MPSTRRTYSTCPRRVQTHEAPGCGAAQDIVSDIFVVKEPSMSDDLTALIASLAQHRLSLLGGEGAPFIKGAIGEVDPVVLAKTIRTQLDEGPSGARREDTPAYQALSGITSYWQGMLTP